MPVDIKRSSRNGSALSYMLTSPIWAALSYACSLLMEFAAAVCMRAASTDDLNST